MSAADGPVLISGDGHKRFKADRQDGGGSRQLACEECYKAKARCDLGHPCSRCVKLMHDCRPRTRPSNISVACAACHAVKRLCDGGSPCGRCERLNVECIPFSSDRPHPRRQHRRPKGPVGPVLVEPVAQPIAVPPFGGSWMSLGDPVTSVSADVTTPSGTTSESDRDSQAALRANRKRRLEDDSESAARFRDNDGDEGDDGDGDDEGDGLLGVVDAADGDSSLVFLGADDGAMAATGGRGRVPGSGSRGGSSVGTMSPLSFSKSASASRSAHLDLLPPTFGSRQISGGGVMPLGLVSPMLPDAGTSFGAQYNPFMSESGGAPAYADNPFMRDMAFSASPPPPNADRDNLGVMVRVGSGADAGSAVSGGGGSGGSGRSSPWPDVLSFLEPSPYDSFSDRFVRAPWSMLHEKFTGEALHVPRPELGAVEGVAVTEDIPVSLAALSSPSAGASVPRLLWAPRLSLVWREHLRERVLRRIREGSINPIAPLYASMLARYLPPADYAELAESLASKRQLPGGGHPDAHGQHLPQHRSYQMPDQDQVQPVDMPPIGSLHDGRTALRVEEVTSCGEGGDEVLPAVVPVQALVLDGESPPPSPTGQSGAGSLPGPTAGRNHQRLPGGVDAHAPLPPQAGYDDEDQLCHMMWSKCKVYADIMTKEVAARVSRIEKEGVILTPLHAVISVDLFRMRGKDGEKPGPVTSKVYLNERATTLLGFTAADVMAIMCGRQVCEPPNTNPHVRLYAASRDTRLLLWWLVAPEDVGEQMRAEMEAIFGLSDSYTTRLRVRTRAGQELLVEETVKLTQPQDPLACPGIQMLCSALFSFLPIPQDDDLGFLRPN